MIFEVSTWNYLCEKGEKADLDRAISEIIGDGFGVELWLGWYPDAEAVGRGNWDHLREILRDAPFVSLHTKLGDFDPDALREEIDMCSFVGGRVLVVHSGTLGLSQDNPHNPAIGGISEYALSKGVTLALENGSPEILKCAISDVDVFSGEGGLGICVDVGHANMLRGSYESPVVEILDMFSERLVHLHLADNFGEKDDHLTPGDGTIDWESVASKLLAMGFDGSAAFEINSKSARENALRGREFLEGLIGQMDG